MPVKKGGLKRIFIVVFVLEVIILIISSGLNRQLQIGLENGRFIIRNVMHEYNLQEKITEEFQPDRYLQDKGEKAEIYGSERLYTIFSKIFGLKNAISAFHLLRILLIVDLTMLGLAWLIRRQIFSRPSKPQVLIEMLYSFFEDFVRDTLGKNNLRFTPYIVTLFLFIWTCNMIGLIPIPGMMEPTRNLNVPLGLGFMAVILVHITAIRHKGLINWFKGFAEPLAFLAPLNIVGELSKAISISFRLFGNILGGAIIMLVVSSLVKFVMLPIGLNLFFGLFVGTIQAFVFTMLALTYIGVEIAE